MYHFFAMLSRMKYINRWGLMRNTREENLCEHSLEVALAAHALAVIGNKHFGRSYDPQRAAVLALLHERDYYALELAPAIAERSDGAIVLTFPYAILYRMIDQEYIQEMPKRIAPDGRRRQYFHITDAGRVYFKKIWAVYQRFIVGVDLLADRTLPDLERGEGK